MNCPNPNCKATGLPDDARFCPDCGCDIIDFLYQSERQKQREEEAEAERLRVQKEKEEYLRKREEERLKKEAKEKRKREQKNKLCITKDYCVIKDSSIELGWEGNGIREVFIDGVKIISSPAVFPLPTKSHCYTTTFKGIDEEITYLAPVAVVDGKYFRTAEEYSEEMCMSNITYQKLERKIRVIYILIRIFVPIIECLLLPLALFLERSIFSNDKSWLLALLIVVILTLLCAPLTAGFIENGLENTKWHKQLQIIKSQYENEFENLCREK